MFEKAAQHHPAILGAGFGYGSLTAWTRGFPDTARDRMREAIAGAIRIKSPFELCHTHTLASVLQLLLREFANAESVAKTTVALADEHGYLQLGSAARISLGVSEAALGDVVDGMQKIEAGLRGWSESDEKIYWTLFLSWVATTQANNGKVSDALETVEKALMMNPTELSFMPAAILTREDLRLRLHQAAGAEEDFGEAVALSKNLGAKSWELRATTNLARLLRDTNRRDEARAMLGEIYNWFTEGFDTADLKEAKALLDELSA